MPRPEEFAKARWSFRPVNRDDALAIVAWRYPLPYDRYNLSDRNVEDEVIELLNPAYRTHSAFHSGELVGFRTFGINAQVPGFDYDRSHVDTGGGLAPHACGQGLGAAWIRAGLELGNRLTGSPRFRVTIAGFNQRALRAATQAGFHPQARFTGQREGREYVVLTIDLTRSG